MKEDNLCEIKHCKQPSFVEYYKHKVCKKHWQKECDEDDKFNLKEEFGIK